MGTITSIKTAKKKFRVVFPGIDKPDPGNERHQEMVDTRLLEIGRPVKVANDTLLDLAGDPSGHGGGESRSIELERLSEERSKRRRELSQAWDLARTAGFTVGKFEDYIR